MLHRLLLVTMAVVALGLATGTHASTDGTAISAADVADPTVSDRDGRVSRHQLLLLLLELQLIDRQGNEPPPELPAPPEARPIVGTVTIYFGFDEAYITPAAKRALSRFLMTMEGESGDNAIEIVISGHADRAGPEAYNLELSRRRALAAASALIEAGFTVEAMSEPRIEAKGEGEPAHATANGVAAAANRRAVITVLGHGNAAMHRPMWERAFGCFSSDYCFAEPAASPDAAAGSLPPRWTVSLRISRAIGRRP